MRFLLLLLCIAPSQPASSAPADNKKLILSGESGDPCQGHVQVYYRGTWGYVGDQYWNKSTAEVVCRSAHCGTPEEGPPETEMRPYGSTVWLNEVRCNGHETNLWDCKHPGFNISFYHKNTVRKIKCSSKVNVSLDREGCAGVVQWSISGKNQPGYFCAQGWRKTEADILCKDLKCGESRDVSTQDWMIPENVQRSMMMVNCFDTHVTHLWQCVTEESTECTTPATVECINHKQLQLRGDRSNVCSGQLEAEHNTTTWNPVTDNLSRTTYDVWCKQMNCGTTKSHTQNESGTELTCSERVAVVLMDGGERSVCYGGVHVEVNNVTAVCGSSWTKTEAEVVCRTLKCGEVMSHEVVPVARGAAGVMDRVSCRGSESSLWYCRAARPRDLTCSSQPYVVCSDSVNVRLKDGPGRCSGRVEVQYQGQWRQVDTEGWTEENSDTVCRHMKCGTHVSDSSDYFVQGPRLFLTKRLQCSEKTSHISECFTQLSITPSQNRAVGVTCTDHMAVLLTGSDDHCSGTVTIQRGSATYLLSGSNASWTQECADVVCRQKHCGTASTFSHIPAPAHDNIWNKTYSCSSHSPSLFDCNTTTPSPDHRRTAATVTCSGTIGMNLSNACWGTVNICMGQQCGGVCADAWTHSFSNMLCEVLGCEYAVRHDHTDAPVSRAKVKSLHLAKKTHNLTNSNFVMNEENVTCHLATAVCRGSLRPRLISSRGRCMGNLEGFLYGKWFPVCKDRLTDEMQHIICEQLGCGPALRTMDYIGPQPEEGLSMFRDCVDPSKCSIGIQIIPCKLGGLQCSEWRKIKTSETCSGAVSVYSDGLQWAVSSDGWTEREGQRLCQDLNCGSFRSMSPSLQNSSVWNATFRSKRSLSLSVWNGSFSCDSDATHIWDCAKPRSPSHTQQLHIECQDKPRVTLSGKCHGVLKIDGMEVCDNNRDIDYADLLCQEQECGNGVFTTRVPASPGADYYHMSCDHFHHASLGQCERVLGKCNGQLVSVSCVDNVELRTKKPCGGRLEVKHQQRSEYVCPLNLSDAEFLVKLCEELHCHHGLSGQQLVILNKEKAKENKVKENQVDLETVLHCTTDHRNMKYCVTQKPCGRAAPAEIYCEKQKQPTSEIAVPKPDMGPIFLAVGLVLVAVIVIVIFVRLFVVKKDKNVRNVPMTRFSRNEVEFESGDYDDVRDKEEELENLRHSRFAAETNVVMEKDTRSVSSYDDIDKAVEAQPLTPRPLTPQQASTTGAGEDALDDQPEYYDDIDDGGGGGESDVTHVKAELHDATWERGAVASVAPPQGDEGHLVVGQDW